jgi:hypothetical protein
LANSNGWANWPFFCGVIGYGASALWRQDLNLAEIGQEWILASTLLRALGRTYTMRKDALWGWYVVAVALVWLSLIPGRVAAN